MGVIFPFLVWLVLGLPLEMVLRPVFLLASLPAGLVVGWVNYLPARLILAVPLKSLACMLIMDARLKPWDQLL